MSENEETKVIFMGLVSQGDDPYEDEEYQEVESEVDFERELINALG